MGLLHKILFLIVVLGVFREATSQNSTLSPSPSVSTSTSGSNSVSITNSISNSYSTSVSNSESNSVSNSVSNSISNSVSNSNSNSISNSISGSVSGTISNTASIAASISLTISQTVSYQFGLPQASNVGNSCPTTATQICLYFTSSYNYVSYNVIVVTNGTSYTLTTNTVPTPSNPFIISKNNVPGFTPGQTYYLQVEGVTSQGAVGPLSVPFAVTNNFPTIDSAPYDTTRIHEVRCGLVGNLLQCNWVNGNVFTATQTKLVVRCSGAAPNTAGFQLASFAYTVSPTATFLETVVPFGSTCTSKLKSKYNNGGKKTKFVLRNVVSLAYVGP